MKVSLIAIGRRMPDWIASGVDEYAHRFPRELEFELRALHVPVSRHQDAAEGRRLEGQALLAALPASARVILLDEGGQAFGSSELAERLSGDRDENRDWALLVGGAAGHDDAVRQRADWSWSLSRLTFPHMLVRVIVAEQIYRAWSIVHHHPYHRE